MKCERCGANVPEGVTVCSACGHTVGPDGGRAAGGPTTGAGDAPQGTAFLPQALPDDPIAGDGSSGRPGVPIAAWRLKVLKRDELRSATEPEGHTRAARRSRRERERARRTRSEEVRARRSRMHVCLAAALLVAAVAAGAAGITYALEMWGGTSVPNVVGVSEGNARQLLEQKGFSAAVQTEPSDTLEGHVISISPPEGSRVDPGSTVTLVVSSARHMPSIVGLTEDEARAALEEAGARNVRFVSKVSLEPEGMVTDARPAADAVFMSTDEVVVTVSRLPRMPDVVGEDEESALAALEQTEIAADVSYERGTAEDRLRVLRTDPKVGQPVGEGGASLVVGDPLINTVRLSDYFDATAPHIRDFLVGEGMEYKVGHLTQDGHLVARFDDAQGSYVAFLSDPWSHAVARDKATLVDVMADAPRVEGVRVSVPVTHPAAPASQAAQPGQAGQEGKAAQAATESHPASLFTMDDVQVERQTAVAISELFGLGQPLDECTQDTIRLPKGTSNTGHAFYCCFGEVENCVWTILLRGKASNGKTEATEVVVTCAPRSTYATTDLTAYDGKVCDYVAYQDEYAK